MRLFEDCFAATQASSRRGFAVRCPGNRSTFAAFFGHVGMLSARRLAVGANGCGRGFDDLISVGAFAFDRELLEAADVVEGHDVVEARRRRRHHHDEVRGLELGQPGMEVVVLPLRLFKPLSHIVVDGVGVTVVGGFEDLDVVEGHLEDVTHESVFFRTRLKIIEYEFLSTNNLGVQV